MPADKASLIANANNRNVWRNLAHVFPHPYTDADADAWFHIAASPGRSIHFAIELDGAAVGGISARTGDGSSCVRPTSATGSARRTGARVSSPPPDSALLEYLKADARFARLEAPVFEWNPSSMRVLEKLGFERVALLRKSVTKDGQLIDSVLYSCLL